MTMEEIQAERIELMNKCIEQLDGRIKTRDIDIETVFEFNGDKNMITTKNKCKYCGIDIEVFQKTEEEAIHYILCGHIFL